MYTQISPCEMDFKDTNPQDNMSKDNSTQVSLSKRIIITILARNVSLKTISLLVSLSLGVYQSNST